MAGGDDTGPPAVFTPYAQLRETHSAVIFLVGDRAYKLKKPVDLGFLDFSTPALRRAACERELVLNRRFTTDVYLGISEVVGLDDEVAEPLLTMRRMPEDRRLAHLVRSGVDVGPELRRLASLVARFHEVAERSPDIARHGEREALERRWADNFNQVLPYVGVRVDAERYEDVRRLVRRYLGGREVLLTHRSASGAVVDGHGDLLAEDIFCLPGGIQVLDCLEFDDELRYLDRIDDVACLVMDLERLGSPEGARTFLDAYRAESGDPAPASLVHHYVAYRAFMRAKVACLPGAADHDTQQAAVLLDLAHRHLVEARVRLILVGGSPGTGKTTTAKALGAAMGCRVISSDRVRKELAQVTPGSSTRTEFRTGLYDPAWTQRTYRELVTRAEHLVRLGESVVVDATWADESHREQMRALADRTGTDLDCFRCVVDDEVADRRIEHRRSISDADPAVAARIREQFHDWPDATEIDSARPVETLVAQMTRRVDNAPK